MLSLITTIEQFRAHVGLNASTTDSDYFLTLQADILLAEDDYLRPLLGADFYDGLLETAPAEGDTVQERLRYLLTSALANLTMVGFLDVAQVQISGSGVQIISSDREKTAFPWQINNLKASFSRKGSNGLEKVLAYLEEHAEDFPTWASSATTTRARAHFINTPAQFSEHYNINNARLTFDALLPLLHKTESFALEPVLGEAFLDELRAQQAAGTLSPENAALVEKYIRPALAHLVMGLAIGELGFSLNGNSFELNVYRSDDSNSKESDPGLQKLLDMKGNQALHDGERFLRQLRTKLNKEASAEKYATYFASSAYEVPTAAPYIRNQSTDRVFGAF
jgi:hypothetical protein